MTRSKTNISYQDPFDPATITAQLSAPASEIEHAKVNNT